MNEIEELKEKLEIQKEINKDYVDECEELKQTIRSLNCELELKRDALESIAQQYKSLSENSAHEFKLLNARIKELEEQLKSSEME